MFLKVKQFYFHVMIRNGVNLQNLTLSIPLLQMMAQNMQNKNAENEQQNDVLQNVVKESEVK